MSALDVGLSEEVADVGLWMDVTPVLSVSCSERMGLFGMSDFDVGLAGESVVEVGLRVESVVEGAVGSVGVESAGKISISTCFEREREEITYQHCLCHKVLQQQHHPSLHLRAHDLVSHFESG